MSLQAQPGMTMCTFGYHCKNSRAHSGRANSRASDPALNDYLSYSSRIIFFGIFLLPLHVVPEEDAEDAREDPLSPSQREQHQQKEKKPMKYKDVVREQILQARSAEEVISSDDDEDEEEEEGGNRRRVKGGEGQEAGRKILAYDEEQEQLRRGFLGSVAEQEGGFESEGGDDEEDGDGLLKVGNCFLRFLFGTFGDSCCFVAGSLAVWCTGVASGEGTSNCLFCLALISPRLLSSALVPDFFNLEGWGRKR